MAQIRETSAIPMGKGCRMVFKVNDAEPPSSIHHHWAETSYDGAPSSWCPDIGSHWHRHHDEHMQVLVGRIDFVLEGQRITLTPSDPPLLIPKMHVHSLKFVRGVPTTFTEKTDPVGEFKERFFRDLLGTEDGKPDFWTVSRSFYDGDTFFALPGGFKAVDEGFTWALGAVAKWWWPKKEGGVVPVPSAAVEKVAPQT